MRSGIRRMVIGAAALAWAASACLAQGTPQGPVRPPTPPDVKRIPIEAKVPPPPIPVEEIVKRFTQKEDELKRTQDAYNFQISVRVQEFPADGSASAEMQINSETYRKADGQRYGRVLSENIGQMRYTDLFREDLQELAALPMFVLTTDQLARYDITYAGSQPLDELTTYIFRVHPKRLERRERQFEGVIWVDDRDFVVVKAYGKWVAEVLPEAKVMPFQMFEMYRQVVDDKYWLPAYVRSEDEVKTQAGAARIRLTMRYTDYKAAPPTSPN